MQKIIFITGKGGVGKSTFAAALALKESQKGKKTLLVELGDKSFFQDYLNISKVGYTPNQIKENLYIAIWSGNNSLKDYATYLLKSENLYKLFFENQITKTLVDIAPGLNELSLVGKITSSLRQVGPELDYDIIVVDAYSTGHFLPLLRAPKGMAQAIKIGPMAEQSKKISEILKNPNSTQYYIVSLPEELPVIESLEIFQSILEETGIQPTIIFNKNISDVPQYSGNDQRLTSFHNFLSQTHQKQITLKSKFEGKKVISLPYIYSVNNWEVIETLSKELP